MKSLKNSTFFKNLFFIFLVSTWPVAHFISINFTDNIISKNIILFGFFNFLFFFFLFFLIFFLFRIREQKAFNIFIISIFIFFLFGGFEAVILNLTNTYENSAKYSVLLQIISFYFLVKLIRTQKIMLMFLLTLWVMPLSKLVINNKISNLDTKKIEETYNNAFVSNHNIYFIILDEYAREDVLNDYLEFDNSYFLKKVQDKGFFYNKNSLSNFDTTPLSISTTLNMDYYTFSTAYDVSIIQNQSKILNILKSNGYENIFIESGGNSQIVCNGLEDLCIKGGTINDDIALILKMTPIWRLMRSSYFYRYFESVYILTDLEESIEKALDQYKKSSRNFFLFAHILSPHDPKRYNSDCSKFVSLNPSLGNHSIESYKIDLKCLNESVIRTIQKIEKKDSSDPIIFVVSDHGISRSMVGNPEDKILRLKNLMLIKNPKKCNNFLTNDLTLVNLMNFAVSCLANKKIKFKENKHFIHDSKKEKLIDVTEKVKINKEK